MIWFSKHPFRCACFIKTECVHAWCQYDIQYVDLGLKLFGFPCINRFSLANCILSQLFQTPPRDCSSSKRGRHLIIELGPLRRSHIHIINYWTAVMASRILAMRNLSTPSVALRTSRQLSTSSRRFAEVATPLPIRKPVGAFRGGSVQLFCSLRPLFLLISTTPTSECRWTWIKKANFPQAIWFLTRQHIGRCGCLLLRLGGVQSIEWTLDGRYLCAFLHLVLPAANPYCREPPGSMDIESEAGLTCLITEPPSFRTTSAHLRSNIGGEARWAGEEQEVDCDTVGCSLVIGAYATIWTLYIC